MRRKRFFRLLLLMSDVAVLYGSLAAVLIIRYGVEAFSQNWEVHFYPFTVVFFIWALIHYISGLYDPLSFILNRAVVERLIKSLIVVGGIAIALFYMVPAFDIAPKTNLLLDLFLSGILMLLIRFIISGIIRKLSPIRALVLGDAEEIRALARFVNESPQFGFYIIHRKELLPGSLVETIHSERISVVVAPKNNTLRDEIVAILYAILPLGITFVDFPTFYERIFGKVPVSLISETWFLENLAETDKRVLEVVKRVVDILLSLLLFIPLTILYLPIAAAIKIDSKGRVIHRNARIGRQGKRFELIKFRTMYANSEMNGPQWTQKNDPRITRVGKMLRTTRLDELPQIINILRGDLSFIGPRPEQPEFVQNLQKEIPYYAMRHLVRPGLSGWAQINPPYYYSGTADSLLKLQYDLFYIKNRDLGLDFSIMLRTLFILVSRVGQ